ncbi:crossover junction endodeoxyribonuclease RuvC [Paenibacillus polymyxa]|uniref:hypothetical protein n=1 Tax=Paenibacillus polymyxa TaxID=1406 RepID=UPI0008FB44B9|nr:hypothetical protein [Paenibacillus polymyxa]APB77414.1 crossover junction endodeoxyribonuclease RuvC [Paenibacillus polymyxa]
MTRYVGIDPSTKTGVCILDADGNVLDALEVTAAGKDPERMSDIITDVCENVDYGDVVVIEGFGFASQSGFLLGGIGWGIRLNLYERYIKYQEAAPAALKKFASGKGNTKKDELAVEIFKRWGFQHGSDNVRDAFVLAQIARSIRLGGGDTKYQQEVIQTILAPPVKKKKKA